jgi:hypothetical protein
MPFKTFLALISVVACVSFAHRREKKEYDRDINYDETRLPHYDLPPVLVASSGQKVTTARQWEETRRPDILALYSNLIYGRVPEPAIPIKKEFDVVAVDSQFMDGKATRKDIDIRLSNERGALSIRFLVFVPNNATKPVPAFFKHSFNNTKGHDFDVSDT